MKTSIRKQFAGIYIGLMAGTILLCWFISNTFLEEFYVSNKIKAIQSAYEKINETIDGGIDSETQQELTDICMKYNITALVIDAASYSVYASPNGGDELEMRLFGYIVGRITEPQDTPNRIRDENQIGNRRKTNEYVEMYGFMDNGSAYIIRTPMESIQESASIATRFLAYVGSVMVVVSGIVIWLVSRKFTKPILELAKISERMTHLDFEAKYNSNSRNEISLLGENINKLSESLEETISELKTANNELKKDIEKKERIDEMRKEFLSNVSHELKTPIALIQGYAEGLQEGIHEDPESRDFYCEVIIDEAKKMNHMVKKLLTLNQLEFGNDMVAMERFDVVTLIRNYIQSVSILTMQNDIEVRLENSDPIYVWADEFKVEEVFMNYFTNAVNHCAGKKVIDIKLERKMEEKVRIGVFNTGNPIPEDSIEQIWDKFYKVDKARTREYGGSGIGLSIVKAIMESLHQPYGVENYTNGVRFWFELETVQEEQNE